MVIPTANLKKQVNTPNASIGKVEDPSDSIRQSFQPAISLVQKIASVGDPILKFQVAQKKAEEDKKANDAYTTLVDEANKVMDSFSEVKKDGAEKYYDETFKTKIKEIEDAFSGVINNIEDADIRESTRRQANQFKLSLRGQANRHRFNEKMSSVKDSTDNKISVLGQEAIKNTTANAKDNMVILAHANNQILGEIAKKEAYWSSTDKSEDSKQFKEAEKSLKSSSAVKIEAQAHVNKVVESIYNSMVGQSKGMPFGKKYTEAKQFLKYAYEKGYIDGNTYQKLTSEAEIEDLKTELLLNPEEFMENGVVSQSKVDAYGNSSLLSPWERAALLSDLKKSDNSSGKWSQEDKDILEELEWKQEDFVDQKRSNLLLKTNDEYRGLQLLQNLSKEELADQIRKDYRSIDPVEAFNAYREIIAERDQLVNINGKKRRVRTKKLRDLEESLLDYFRFYAENYDDELVDQSRRSGPYGLLETAVRTHIGSGRKLTAAEVGLHGIIRNYITERDRGFGMPGAEKTIRAVEMADAGALYLENISKAGLKYDAIVEDEYQDPRSQAKLQMAYADAIHNTNIAIGADVNDESFVASVTTKNMTSWRDYEASLNKFADFYGESSVAREQYNSAQLYYMGGQLVGTYAAKNIFGLESAKSPEDYVRIKNEKERAYISKMYEEKQKIKQKYNEERMKALEKKNKKGVAK